MKYILLSIFLALVGCSQKPSEETAEAIDQAQTLLSQEKCDEAIKLLEDIGRKPEDAIYVQVLASAYACRAGFSMIQFIGTDIDQIDSAKLFPSVSRLSYSNESVVDSLAYTSLKEALLILGGTDFKQDTRTSKFGPRKAGDMGVQVLVLSLVQLGKFLNFYGEVDSDGIKGGAAATDICFINYTDSSAQAIVTGLDAANHCNSFTAGRPELSGANQVKRMCEGITTLGNIIDILENLDLSGNETLGDLGKLATNVATLRAEAGSQAYFLDLTSQATCETLLASTAEFNKAQIYFAAVFEDQLP